MIELRRVGADFAPQLVDLRWTAFAQAYAGEHSAENIRAYCESTYTLEAALETLADPASVCVVAFRYDRALGFHWVKHHDCPLPLDGASSELKQVYILAEAFGTGLGKRLLDDAIRCVQEAGRPWLWLAVSERNHRARAFYDKHGFESLGVGPVFAVGTDRLTSTVMGFNCDTTSP